MSADLKIRTCLLFLSTFCWISRGEMHFFVRLFSLGFDRICCLRISWIRRGRWRSYCYWIGYALGLLLFARWAGRLLIDTFCVEIHMRWGFLASGIPLNLCLVLQVILNHLWNDFCWKMLTQRSFCCLVVLVYCLSFHGLFLNELGSFQTLEGVV